jgi:predicted RNA-binding Zn ribbon-like protein
MTISWTKHRFSGGILALDTANTIVHRGDPARSFDRFEDPAEIARFASAAAGFRMDELGGRPLTAPDPEGIALRVLAIREATDCLFRSAAVTGKMEIRLLPVFLAACAASLDGHSGHIGGPGQPFGDPARPIAFEVALAVSALSLLSGDAVRRLKVCPNCNWLFLDRSRNSSRLWCDMTVCGNRHKAKRHYHRRKAVLEENSHV